jgi:hypothetical protein
MSLVVDIAQSEPADVAHAILQLRGAPVELIEEIERIDHKLDRLHSVAWRKANAMVRDLDAGELLWPGWKEKGRSEVRP